MLDIDDLQALEFLREEHHLKIIPRLTDRNSIKRALLLYQKILKEKFGALLREGEGVVDAFIRHALLSRAGAAHLDLSTTGMLVRYRIGQGLHEAMQLPEHIGKALSERLKNLAKLLPTSSTLQEGRFKVENDGERVAVHVSSLPVHEGEKMVLRFARERNGQSGFNLSSLGFHGEGVVDAFIRHALLSRAGAAHLDLSTTGMLVRYRIGQGLHEAMQLPEHIGKALSERLKNLAKLLPTSSTLQEGRFKVENEGERVAVHVSSLPVHDGEKIILRFARDSHGQSGFTLSSLGFHGEGLERVHEALKNRSGLIVISGPEGSGKTTALYTLLDLLSSPHLSIATVEETIERRLANITQTAVDEKKGISWGSTLRAVLKQDVDVVMIVDISRPEVAALGASAAARGVLVLAGLTSSAPAAGVIKETEALGVSSLSLSSTLKLVVALQTVKKLCPNHQTLHGLSRVESSKLEDRANFGRVLASLKEEKIISFDKAWKELQFATAEGCRKCEEGYKGIIGLQEILPTLTPIQNMILRGEEPEKMDEIARQAGMLTLAEDGLFKAAQGKTSIEELSSLM